MTATFHNETCVNKHNDLPIAASACVDMPSTDGAVALHQDQHLRMRDASGWTIKAGSGTIWITQESDSRDIVLKAGDSFVLDRPGSALVSSLGDATVCLKQGTPDRQAQTRKTASRFLPSFSGAFSRFA